MSRYCYQHRRMTCPACLAAQPGAVGAWARFTQTLVALWWVTVVLVILVGAAVAAVRSL